jgi:enoyl-CoA hydratase/carnithine racemase
VTILPGDGAAVRLIRALREQGGIEELETPHLFDAEDVVEAGGFNGLLGLPLPPDKLIQETKARLLAP